MGLHACPGKAMTVQMANRESIENDIARMALNDRAAFQRVYHATSGKLFGICLRVLDHRAEAEDALQETYVKIWKNADRYAAGGYSPITWLATIARNTAIDKLRARKITSDINDAPHLAAPGPTPEAAVIAASESRQIVNCLEELDADKAGAVRGAYLDGKSYQDLADYYTVPLNTMRTWLRRSLIALRECLAR